MAAVLLDHVKPSDRALTEDEPGGFFWKTSLAKGSSAIVLDTSHGRFVLHVHRTQRTDAGASEADEKRFLGWIERVRAGLPVETDEGSARLTLIEEIHADVVGRFPLGIAEDLYSVITALHIGEDEDAIAELDQLADTEKRSRELNAKGASS